MEKLAKLGEDLTKGLHDLKGAQEQLKKDTDGLVTEKVNKIADDLGAKFQELQDGQAKLQAAMERAATDTGEKADETEACEQKAAFDAFLRAGGDKNRLTPEITSPTVATS